MNKRGQLTAIIIVGILILIGIVALIYLYATSEERKLEAEYEEAAEVEKGLSELDVFVRNCIRTTTGDGLLTLGLQGGYYNLPLKTFGTIYSEVPFYYFEGDISDMPVLSDIKEEFDKYMNDNLRECVNDFETFKAQGYEVEEGSIYTNSKITSKGLLVDIDYPVSLTRQGVKQTFGEYSVAYPVRLRDVYSAVQEIMNKVDANPGLINQNLIFDLMAEKNLQIDTLLYEDSVIYVIRDEQSQISGVPFTFLFAVKAGEANNPPLLLNLPDELRARLNQEFYFDVNAEDKDYDRLVFTDNTEMFDIDPYSGEINFTPDSEDIGVSSIQISVTDSIDTTTKTIRFTVIS